MVEDSNHGHGAEVDTDWNSVRGSSFLGTVKHFDYIYGRSRKERIHSSCKTIAPVST